MTKTTGARYFAEFLHGSGVTHVFFMPAMMWRGLAEMEELGIHRIMVHGEKTAAYMADGYARASGRPGICMAQQIGASNLAAGLRDAYMACTPMIAITGGASRAGRYRNAYQEVEDFAQFDSVTKFNAYVDDSSRLPDMLRQAFREATSGTPRPTHLRFRDSHGESVEADGDLEMQIDKRFIQAPAFRPLAEETAISEAARALASAERPIIVAGGGVMYSDARAEVVALAERLDIPVATSLNAKGTIADTHPLAVGVAGTYSRVCANRAVNDADLVFFIGSRTGGQVTTVWTVPNQKTRVIQLDIEAREIGRNYPNAIGLCGDAKVTLQRLVASVAQPRKNPAWVKHVQALVAEWRADADKYRTSDAVPMRPERLGKEITDALPRDGVVVSDTGHSGMWTAQMIERNSPGQRYIRCAGSMGWGFPGSLGVKCALPDRPVLCWTGDGAMYYHLADLETAARYGINVVVVVNNNTALNQEIPLVDAAYGGPARGRSAEMWEFKPVNFAKVAESLGCVGLRVETPAQFKAALGEAFSLKLPVVIDAVTDVGAFATKAWRPAGAPGGH
ncbi:MAG TPA: thiamine pyrophosphate-binding protein [Bradyrhizobium sp.]